VSVRERSVLGELGEAVGHAINAVSTRQLLSTESVVELELESTDPADALAAATYATDCGLELAGVVPSDAHSALAYVRVSGDPEAAASALADATEGSVRLVRDDDGDGLLEWRVSGEDLLGTIVDHGAHVGSFEATDGTVTYEADVASDDVVRSLLDSLERPYDGVRLLAKRERASPLEVSNSLPEDSIEGLTDRQREAIEAAYRAGYFDGPRESTAEEVASAMDIAPSTLHSHLRKAEGSLLAELFEQRSVTE
jgi:predicted DNA binding protein